MDSHADAEPVEILWWFAHTGHNVRQDFKWENHVSYILLLKRSLLPDMFGLRPFLTVVLEIFNDLETHDFLSENFNRFDLFLAGNFAGFNRFSGRN